MFPILVRFQSNTNIKQLLDEVEHDIMNYQNRGLCYLPKPKAEADNTDNTDTDNTDNTETNLFLPYKSLVLNITQQCRWSYFKPESPLVVST